MRGRGRTRGRGRGYDDDHERRGEYGRADRDGRGRGRFEDDSNNRQRSGATYDERFESGRGPYAGPVTNGYAVNTGPGGYTAVPQAPPSANIASRLSTPLNINKVLKQVTDDRLEQARKVQQVCNLPDMCSRPNALTQLLAALKQPQSGPPPISAAAPVPTPPAPMPPPGGAPGIPGIPPMPPPSGYYSQHGTAPLQAPPFPPNNPYGAMPPLPPPGAQSNQASGLPPNILTLLQSVQRQPPVTPQYGVPPQVMNSPPPATGGSTQYQQLMSYLVKKIIV